MKKVVLIIAIMLGAVATAQDYKTHLDKANEALDASNFRKAKENATKAIEFNPQSLDAYWIRSRASLTSSSTEKDFRTAISDLNFIISNGGASAKVYNALGLAETELASYIFRFKKPKENKGFSDDNSAFVKEQKAFFNEAITHYENAKLAYKKAEEINPEEKQNVSFRIKDISKALAEIDTATKNLK